ncbi:hypothetical protein D3C76_1545370 [compost metagenome]
MIFIASLTPPVTVEIPFASPAAPIVNAPMPITVLAVSGDMFFNTPVISSKTDLTEGAKSFPIFNSSVPNGNNDILVSLKAA